MLQIKSLITIKKTPDRPRKLHRQIINIRAHKEGADRKKWKESAASLQDTARCTGV